MPQTWRPIFSLSTSMKHTGVYTALGLFCSSSASMAPMRPAPMMAMRILFLVGITVVKASLVREMPVSR